MTHERLARWRRWSACDVGEAKRRKGWRMSRALPSLQLRHTSNEQSPFRRFRYVKPHSPTLTSRRLGYITAHSPTLPSLYLRHSSFSNLPVISSTSQLILQPFFRFSYVTGSSLNVTSRAAHVLILVSYYLPGPVIIIPRRGRRIFFQSINILNMTSFGREVKPWVPCRRSTARKRTSSQN